MKKIQFHPFKFINDTIEIRIDFFSRETFEIDNKSYRIYKESIFSNDKNLNRVIYEAIDGAIE